MPFPLPRVRAASSLRAASPLRAAVVLLALLALLAASCSSGDADSADDAEPTTAPTVEGEFIDPSELPTTDAETALQGVDTETPPPDGYCELSGYLNSAEMSQEYDVAVKGGEGSDDAIANINAQFAELERLAPPGLADDAAAVGGVIDNYLRAVSTAVKDDDYVDVTELEEEFKSVADSGARLNAYDEVVCGNPAPGSSGT